MVALSVAIFMALFMWGSNFVGWYDPAGKVRLALFATFVLGIICGFKVKD